MSTRLKRMDRLSWLSLKRTLTVGVLTGVCSFLPACATTPVPAPTNRTVVIIDSSGSFKRRFRQAIERSTDLLTAMAQTKLHRWEAGTDSVTIIAMDAMPDVIWEGSLKELQAVDLSVWSNRLQSRSDYLACTDVGAAFLLAADRLKGDPRFVSKYLFVFSDLVDEPPITSSKKCRAVQHPSPPPDSLPWESLNDVSVGAMWLPPDQKLVWRRAIADAGLSESFKLLSDSESEAAAIAVPPRPQVKLTDGDVAEQRERTIEAAWTIGSWIVYAAGALSGLFGVGVVVAIVGRRRNRARRPSADPRAVRLRARGGHSHA